MNDRWMVVDETIDGTTYAIDEDGHHHEVVDAQVESHRPLCADNDA